MSGLRFANKRTLSLLLPSPFCLLLWMGIVGHNFAFMERARWIISQKRSISYIINNGLKKLIQPFEIMPLIKTNFTALNLILYRLKYRFIVYVKDIFIYAFYRLLIDILSAILVWLLPSRSLPYLYICSFTLCSGDKWLYFLTTPRNSNKKK